MLMKIPSLMENEYSKTVENFAEKMQSLKISAEIESQIAIIEDPEEKKNF